MICMYVVEHVLCFVDDLYDIVTHVHFWSFFFSKQKTATEWRISDWSSDVCSSDLPRPRALPRRAAARRGHHLPPRPAPALSRQSRAAVDRRDGDDAVAPRQIWHRLDRSRRSYDLPPRHVGALAHRRGRSRKARPSAPRNRGRPSRSEEHKSEVQYTLR